MQIINAFFTQSKVEILFCGIYHALKLDDLISRMINAYLEQVIKMNKKITIFNR